MKYVIEVEVEDRGLASLIERLKVDVNEDKRQLEISCRINKETTKLHKKVAQTLRDDLHNNLSEFGIGCSEVLLYSDSSNCYQESGFTLEIGRERIYFKVVGSTDRGFNESKYCTYTGKWSLSERLEDGYFREISSRTSQDLVKRWESQIKQVIMSRAAKVKSL